MFAYISFEKVGSVSLWNAFEQRAKERGAGEVNVLDRHTGKSIFPAFMCHQKDLPRGCCASAPANSVIHDERYGFCAAVVPQRRCRYMTVLREPLARAVSAYKLRQRQ